MSLFSQLAQDIQFQLETIGGLSDLQASERFGHVDADSVSMVLEQAARFSEEELLALAASGDLEGCRIEDGQVRLPAGTVETYRHWCELGFPALALPLEHDGMDFPAVALCAVQELGDAANQAFGMLAINLRCAALVLLRYAPPEQAAEWIAALASGELSTTIAISEAQAGSDVGRIRAQARPAEDGTWRLHGSKVWISYGDHDATPQILHLVLARTPDQPAGSRGLSLFAVPKRLPDGGLNGVQALRLEHKMGLHASPTCILEFEDAVALPLSAPGEGIAKLFVMMNAMRLAVAVQGAAAANAAALHALAYARERPQGGPADAPATPITAHADVRRMLLEMCGSAALLRALALRTARYLDLAASDTERAAHWQSLADLLLPVAKTCCAELGFAVVNQGIQVLGGYGYTADYPLERLARDIRVSSIYEGTSGIQAGDFLLRKCLRDGGATLERLLREMDALPEATPLSAPAATLRELLRDAFARLAERQQAGQELTGGAYPFLRLAGLVVFAWCGADLYTSADETRPEQARLKQALALYAVGLEAEGRQWHARALADPALLAGAGLQ